MKIPREKSKNYETDNQSQGVLGATRVMEIKEKKKMKSLDREQEGA